ncbi:MAG: hypothetical protein IKC34_01885 [Clostridia bacterium]|nr:hypothetical protein [Clostridia bacterium]
MKATLKLIVLVICFILCLSLLTACGGDDWNPTGKDVTLIAKGDPAKYLCVYNGNDITTKNAALLFKNEVISNGLKCVPTVYGHTSEDDEFEILFGETGRTASNVASEFLRSKIDDKSDDYHWVFYYRDGKLAIVANDSVAYELAIEDFFNKYMTENGIVFKDTLKEYVTISYNDYFRELSEKKKQEHEEYLDQLTSLLAAQREELSTLRGTWDKHASASSTNLEVNLFADYTEDLMTATTVKWDAPTAYPISEHPRLLFTKDDLPAIRKALSEDTASNESFLRYVDINIQSNCVLPAPTSQGANTTHNFTSSYLNIIQAKALAYLLYGDEYYGYQAILYVKNYIKTLDIVQIPTDQCRSYGYVMYTVALVYDWCYDLLTETDKIQLIAGVENCLCRDDKSKKVVKSKMEVLFPPSAEAAIAGHGNEYQVLRDYLSFAIAIYGDNNSWYEYVGGRVYHDLVPARNYLYQTGNVWQGTGYAFTRHVPTLISAWILQIANGENPYNDVLHDAIWGLFNYEVAPGYIFTDGDKTANLYEQSKYVHHAYLAAYLYDDSAMMAMLEYLLDNHCGGENPFSNGGYSGINDISCVILNALCDTESSGDRYEGMELIKYYGSYLGQYTVRESWDDESSAAVYMRIKERTTGGHEHLDAGTFEIYYKGLLTSDGGIYNSTDHYTYYHTATISHNGLIIYNSLLNKTERGWYSGGQRRPPDINGIALDEWLLNSKMDTGKITGKQHGYANEEETKALYAYIAGDITKAYDSSTVGYVGRRMLTVYTGDEEFPMVFFVYDDILANSKNFEKRFLLQITSPNEPTISGNRVITENGDGRLVLTSLSSDVSINPVGGRVYNSSGNYDEANSSNYSVNGKQLSSGGSDDGHWGRIEIVSTKKNAHSTFMNVIYVTDKGNDSSVDVRKLGSAVGVEGGVFNKKIAAVFATEKNRTKDELSFTVSGDGSVDYYVSGVAAGKWQVTVDGKDCGTYTATEEGGLLTFTAPDGKVVIAPAN